MWLCGSALALLTCQLQSWHSWDAVRLREAFTGPHKGQPVQRLSASGCCCSVPTVLLVGELIFTAQQAWCSPVQDLTWCN